jgi:hypothetical protein
VDADATRRFTGFSQAIVEVINARAWAGIHFRTADIQGVHLGIAVSRFVTARCFKPLR